MKDSVRIINQKVDEIEDRIRAELRDGETPVETAPIILNEVLETLAHEYNPDALQMKPFESGYMRALQDVAYALNCGIEIEEDWREKVQSYAATKG